MLLLLLPRGWCGRRLEVGGQAFKPLLLLLPALLLLCRRGRGCVGGGGPCPPVDGAPLLAALGLWVLGGLARLCVPAWELLLTMGEAGPPGYCVLTAAGGKSARCCCRCCVLLLAAVPSAQMGVGACTSVRRMRTGLLMLMGVGRALHTSTLTGTSSPA